MEKLCVLLLLIGVLAACGGGKTPETSGNPYSTEQKSPGDNPSYDPNRGLGKWTAENLTLGALDENMVTAGEKIQSVKCASCHKLTEEKLVGPGWKGVTSRRKPEWIMNFITNPDPMIDKDPAVQAQLELCLVRMPNQNLSDEDARHVYEFMRHNDGIK